MAPTSPFSLEWQTDQIIKCLLEDEHEHERDPPRGVLYAELEVDSPASKSDDGPFDPVVIAGKLRAVADALNDDIMFQSALAELKQAAAKEALEAAFSHGVEAICQTQVSQKAEVASEMQLIRASVALGLYVKKSSPELKNTIHSVMTTFLSRRVGPWVHQQGGWDKVV
ncbi:bcl-2-like protein 15 [Clinocottus analis]|uniref:bcl-2-like protein 15 n=1 Tax=Clinocottus analis TaxID=304258 RepID=UPI0035BFA6CD